MKKIRFVFGLLLSLSIVTSCVKHDDVLESAIADSGRVLTIEASREGYSSQTRTTLQADGSVYWNPKEEISLFFAAGNYVAGDDGGCKFTSKNDEVVEIAEFSGVVNSSIGGGEELLENGYFWAVYPYSDEVTCDGSSIVTTLPHIQQAVEGTFADDLFITVAHSQNVKMAFKNVCGGIKFCVTNSDIKSVIFRGNNDENLAGKVQVSVDANNKPYVAGVLDGKSEIMVVAPNGGIFVPGKYYYIVALPTPLEAGFTMIFNKTNDSHIEYKRTTEVTINRSRFGVVSNLDTGDAVPDEIEPGGTESGLYLGIIGFNNGLYKYPIRHLSSLSIDGYNSFIDGLSTINGTLLYYAVDESLNSLQEATFPSDLYNVSIVTFTDGLDRGSLDENDEYLSNSDYLTALNDRLTQEKVADLNLDAYTVGVRGDDVTNTTSFQNNLKKLATSSDKVFEITDMSELNGVFSSIADLLGETKYIQKFMLEFKRPSHNEKCRFTFDNVSSYKNSKLYIEGTMNRLTNTFEGVTYVGLTSTSGSDVSGTMNDSNFCVLNFEGLQSVDGELIPTDYVQLWYTEEGIWQLDSEFDFDPGQVSTEKIKRSAVVLLNLDCSSSLGDDFVTLQQNAKSFIAKLLENTTDPYEVSAITLNKSDFELDAGSATTLQATITPSTAIQKGVEWVSTNASVASVDQNGVVTAHCPGLATIIAKTEDNNLTASTDIYVNPKPNFIQYTSSDGSIVTPDNPNGFGANIIGNTYEDGIGKILFDAPVTSIVDFAFYECSSLTSVTIPDGVTSIGDYAFYGCSKLTSITIPNSVTSIGHAAFSDCSSLTIITIPDSVTSIGDSAFSGCSSLYEFCSKYASSDRRCLIIDGALNSFAPSGLTSYTIPDNVTSIGYYAFYGCSKLTSITIPNSVTSIGDYAFMHCSSLTSVTIPDSVTSIGYSAFMHCSSLTSVTIPNSVTSIGDYAFMDCSSLTSVTIPDSVTSIGPGAFLNCSWLKEVYCEATTPPNGGSQMFDYNPSDRKIYVPTASVDAYKSAQYWSDYTDYIVGYDF